MTQDECLALLAVVAHGEPVATEVIGLGLQQGRTAAREIGRRHLNELERQGAVRRVFYGLWLPTEKGRIAAALIMGKDPELMEIFFS